MTNYLYLLALGVVFLGITLRYVPFLRERIPISHRTLGMATAGIASLSYMGVSIVAFTEGKIGSGFTALGISLIWLVNFRVEQCKF